MVSENPLDDSSRDWFQQLPCEAHPQASRKFHSRFRMPIRKPSFRCNHHMCACNTGIPCRHVHVRIQKRTRTACGSPETLASCLACTHGLVPWTWLRSAAKPMVHTARLGRSIVGQDHTLVGDWSPIMLAALHWRVAGMRGCRSWQYGSLPQLMHTCEDTWSP